MLVSPEPLVTNEETILEGLCCSVSRGYGLDTLAGGAPSLLPVPARPGQWSLQSRSLLQQRRPPLHLLSSCVLP